MTTGSMVRGLVLACLTAIALAGTATAQNRAIKTGESYVPGIWIDPDGCEHWVMDDGQRGFMSPHSRPDGTPVCRNINTCAVMNSDQLFASGSAGLGAQAQGRLADFFRKAGAFSYIVIGHTDAAGSDEANMALSLKRATAVARVAKAVGAKISDVRGYGERYPKSSRAVDNRRVEIMCIR